MRDWLKVVVVMWMGLLGVGCTFSQEKPAMATPAALTPLGTAVPAPPRVAATFSTGEAGLAGRVLRNVVYCTLGGESLTMDLYFPKQVDNARWPVTMYIHGGAWSAGDKRSGAGYVEVPALQAAGFVVAAVNYRLAPQYHFPAMIEDVKCAVRFLRAHAAEYGLDPERIGVWGGSAGGHLAALLGTSDASAGWDVGPYLEQSSRVQAVVDMFGPADLPMLFAHTQGQRRFLGVFDASSPDDPVLVSASPVHYVTPDDPPFLLLHGDRDEVVPLEQSERFFAALQQTGVPAQLVVVHNAGHGFQPRGGAISPSREEITRRVVSFFQQVLLPAPGDPAEP